MNMGSQMTLRTSGQTNPGSMDIWSQPQGNQLGLTGQQAQPTASPVQIIQRLLRGKIALAIVLAFIGAVLGAMGGYISQKPQYHALGQVQISPYIPVTETSVAMPYYQQFMTNQAQFIRSSPVLDVLPTVEPWKTAYGNSDDAFAKLTNNLKSEYIKNSFQISLEINDTDREFPVKAIQAIIAAYKKVYKNNTNDDIKVRIEEIKRRKSNYETDSLAAQHEIEDMTTTYGSADLKPLVDAAQQAWMDIDRQYRTVKNNIDSANGAHAALEKGGKEISLEELAQSDAVLAQMMADVRQGQNRVEVEMTNKGANHPSVRVMQRELDVHKRQIDDYANELRKKILCVYPDVEKDRLVTITQGQMDVMQARLSQLKGLVDEAEKRRAAISLDAGKVLNATNRKNVASEQIVALSKSLETLDFQSVQGGTLQEMIVPRIADKVSDKKLLMAGAGGIAGAMVPVAILLLLGLVDTRFRYSDDTHGVSMGGIPLLGILPNLPDRLSDPSQASIAAHCVHQIRTMLQLNAMRDGATAFAVTSASSGDGKTSLSLALGLSFAASGSRTLLIDSDIIGGGLSSRLGVNTDDGIVEALAGVALEQLIQPSDVADLFLLPLGKAQAHHAGSFSPPAVRKMLAEAKKRYEVIIIDTGPVMGSIEATPLCASVDGVILTVARGQSRPLVERAISHLQSVGARLAGVVFNRAQHRDFEQSIGAISIRSAARTGGRGASHNASNDIGAVAKAVVTSVRTDD